MNEQELNKKLAEWAGIKVLGISPAGKPKSSLWGEIDMTGFALYPNETTAKKSCDFTQSLDACFKWLVPKLRELELILEIQDMGGDWHVDLWKILGQNHSTIVACKDDETPALALCLAISEMIE